MANKRPKSFTHIIRAWDTTTDMARALDVPRANVGMWLVRDSIPVWEWRKLITKAKDVGLSLSIDDLIDLAEERHRPRFENVPTFASAEAKAEEVRAKRRALDAEARKANG